MFRTPANAPEVSPTALVEKFSVPIRLTDLLVQDSERTSMKEGFAVEMKKIDEEITRFSNALQRIVVMTKANQEIPATSWDAIFNSPLVQGEGENRTLHLQFDVQNYDPHEVTVKIHKNTLIVEARHEGQTYNRTESREFHREFLRPSGTDPEAIESGLSSDGVLTVLAPLHLQLLTKAATV